MTPLLNDPFILQVEDRLRARVREDGIPSRDRFAALVADVMQDVLADNVATFSKVLASPDRRGVYAAIAAKLFFGAGAS